MEMPPREKVYTLVRSLLENRAMVFQEMCEALEKKLRETEAKVEELEERQKRRLEALKSSATQVRLLAHHFRSRVIMPP